MCEEERWVSGSNLRMDSISSPKKSMRHGPVLFGRVDVEDAAAQGDLPGHFDDVDLGVADREEVLDEHVGQVFFADAQMEGEGGVVVAGEEAHAGGFDGRDDEAHGVRAAGGDLPKGGGAGLLDLGVGREVFKGEDVVRGEAEDVVAIEGAGEIAGAEDGGVEGFGGLVVGDEDERRGVDGAQKERQIEGAGGCCEAGDATPTGAAGEVAAGTFKGF